MIRGNAIPLAVGPCAVWALSLAVGLSVPALDVSAQVAPAKIRLRAVKLPAVRLLRRAAPAPASAKAAPADSRSALPNPAGKAPNGAPVFFLRDRGMVAGEPQFEFLEVKTCYGALSIPRSELIRVRFARRVPPALLARIDKLVSQLGDDGFDAREKAMNDLREIGAPALGRLRKATRSSNEEIKNRATSLVGELYEQASSESDSGESSIPLLSGSQDEIITTRMTIRGRVARGEFLIQSLYGKLRVAAADLAAISFRSVVPRNTKAKVSAQNQPPGNWLDTKLTVEDGQRLKITASGQVTVSNYSVVSGPTGNTSWSGHATFGNFPMLSLVGKVGKRGKPFLVGNSYSGKAKRGGKLYLGIVPFSPYPTGAVGSYQARIRTQ